MQLTYVSSLNEARAAIRVVLQEGESLGNLVGPCESFVPRVDGNKEYDEICERDLPVVEVKPPTKKKRE